ncbi:DUF4876 domain-containing protein [uncultured Bacteroides sp.]|uniref:DUF4876 domain-containing protein n=1 Tax=uncultured Bacteroides sp. TaxID=162156 RepID=UPI002AA6EB72|nr:DUF4876 domain-containing protein [uncultured Bacteroides sp.]
MRTKYVAFLLFLVAIVSFMACSDEEVKTSKVSLELNLPTNINGLSLNSGSFVFTDVTTGTETPIDCIASVVTQLPDGLYNVSFTGTASYTYSKETVVDGETIASDTLVTKSLQGSQQNIEITGGSYSLNLDVYLVNDKADFVIAEIYGVGTYTPGTTSQYNGDQYFRIYNNSDQTLYADGLVLVESKFTTTLKYAYNPDKMDQAMTVQVVAMIPGSGKEHPVEPGKSIIVCDNAINHLEANASSFDLSGADFEWYTQSTSTTNPDSDNPSVPNLDMLYNYTKTIWILNKQGVKAYALARLGVSKEDYLADYTYTYNYVLSTGTTSKNYTEYYIPNDWIIDAVNLSPKSAYVWNVTSASLDMGFTYFGLNNTIKENLGKGVNRKVSYTTVDGREVLQDTNNSSVDFTPASEPSLAGN